MGISADQFWNGSQNGKSMVLMLAQRQNTELVRDACDWLVGVYRKDLEAGAIEKGATMEQAKVIGKNGSAGLLAAVEGMNDRNLVGVATSVIDQVFQRHYNAGKPQYDKAMAWFATELRKRTKNDDEPR